MKRFLLVALTLAPVDPFSLHAADAAKRPRIVGIAQVSLFVHDIEKSCAFYTAFLGFNEPYSLKREDGALSQTWIKINDRQTIELIPEQPAGTDRINRISLQVDGRDRSN